MYTCMFDPSFQTKSGTRNGDPGEEEDISDKLVAKKKKKRESGQSGTATERRHDQPLLLEFESLFESLQVHIHISLQPLPLILHYKIGTRVKEGNCQWRCSNSAE